MIQSKTQKSIVFLYASNGQLESKILNTTLDLYLDYYRTFKIAPKPMKYLLINLTKYVQN